jgi:hypothetical protein
MCEMCWGKGYVLKATGINGITIEIPCPKCQPESNLPAEITKGELLKQFTSSSGKGCVNT